MNCKKFEDLVSELARGQMMDADVRREALAHTKECQSCMLRLADEENLSRGLRALRVEMETVEAPDALEARLLSEFRTREVIYPIVPARSTRRYWLSAIAAMLLIAFGVMAFRLRGEKVQPPKETAHVEINPTPPAPTVQAPQKAEAKGLQAAAPILKPKHKQSSLVAKGRPRKSDKENVDANHVVNEVATDFMPLGYLNAASFQDGGQIVRVELPRSALANFGFPVNMDRYNEKVKADILLGVDGLAHAIRFVQ